MRVTQKGQVTIPLQVRRRLGIQPAATSSSSSTGGARGYSSIRSCRTGVGRMRGAGEGEMSTDEILALTRR